MKRQSGITIGLVLILFGAFGLARALGADWARMERLWPLVVMAGGALAVREGLLQRKYDSLWFGVTALLCGGLFGYITLFGAGWGLLADWWPLVLGFAGIGWLAVWLCERRQWSNAILAALSLLAGGVLLAKNVALLPEAVTAQMLALWPWLLVVAGGALVAQSIVARRAHADRD